MDPGDLTGRLLLATGVIVVVAHIGGRAAARVGQPRVLGEITAGVILGPSVLGAIWPAAAAALFPTEVVAALKPLADVGLVLFMFLVGLELNLEGLRGQGRRAAVVSNASIVVPFGLGVLIGWWVHPELGVTDDAMPFALFVGAAMAVTAFPVLARILQETGLDRTPVGALALACAAVDDVTAWFILAAVLAVAQGTGAASVLAVLMASILYVLAMWFIARPLLAKAPSLPLALAVSLALLSAWTTESIGIHGIFGAFLAGAILPRHAAQAPPLAHRVEPLLKALLLPVFFMIVGLSVEVSTLDSLYRWGVAGVVLLAAVVGKLGGAGLAARATGSSWPEAWTIGTLMNTRGLTEVVILTVGLEEGIIGPPMFTIMLLMALITTFMAVPVLRAAGVVGARSVPVGSVGD